MTLRLLHFSDIHFGQEKPTGWEIHSDVRNEVVRDLEALIRDGEIERADALVLTGDIAQKGQESEFKTASDWIEKVAEVAAKDGAVIRTVPGNHDVNLNRLDATAQLAQRALKQSQVSDIHSFLIRSGDEVRPVAAKFDDYLSFAHAFGSHFPAFNQPYTITYFEMEGGPAIRLIGLNTALISDKEDEKGNLALGQHQYTIPRDPRFVDVVMMHHPTEWLKDREGAEQFLRSRARVHLTGHEHSPGINPQEPVLDFQFLELAAGALNPPTSEAAYGYSYNWIEMQWTVQREERILEIRVFPRRYNSTTTSFCADFDRTGGRISRTVQLRCGKVEVQEDAPQRMAATQLSGGEERIEPSEVLAVHETDTVPEGTNQDDYERLRYLFWRYLDREMRTDVLIRLGLLTEHARKGMPSGIERSAFEDAADVGCLHKLWEATMALVPPEERRANPFNEDE